MGDEDDKALDRSERMRGTERGAERFEKRVAWRAPARSGSQFFVQAVLALLERAFCVEVCLLEHFTNSERSSFPRAGIRGKKLKTLLFFRLLVLLSRRGCAQRPFLF